MQPMAVLVGFYLQPMVVLHLRLVLIPRRQPPCRTLSTCIKCSAARVQPRCSGTINTIMARDSAKRAWQKFEISDAPSRCLCRAMRISRGDARMTHKRNRLCLCVLCRSAVEKRPVHCHRTMAYTSRISIQATRARVGEGERVPFIKKVTQRATTRTINAEAS